MTPAAVMAWHTAEAQRYVLIARNWTSSVEALQGDANGVRAACFHQAAKLAMQTAQQHLDMAHALEPLMGAPLTFAIDLGAEPAFATVRRL